MLNFPQYALDCLEIIEQNGFEAYFVGGCVRDMILARESDDIDIATSAQPQEIIKIFEHTIPTGISHGTVTVIIDGFSIEVTTYRTDGQYTDSRHPEKVEYVSDIRQDLSRRDFTINALAYNPKQEIIDLFGGIGDLERKTIKSVGNPKLRFSEDALRILRAYRFSSVLDFDIESETEKAALNLSDTLSFISGERIYKELIKLLSGKRPQIILGLLNCGGLDFFGIDTCKYDYNTFCRIKDVSDNCLFRFALFVSLCKHDSIKIKTILNAEKKVLDLIDFLDSISDFAIPKTKTEFKRFLSKFGTHKTDLYLSYIKLLYPDRSDDLVGYKNEIEANSEPYLTSHIKINGQVLLELGFKGRKIGELLEKATEYVIEHPENNSREKILEYLKKETH
ncbi:MAG: CCA tRNA nucleotidyltransferase [Ruminococcaceae bacterium]|nr:CCA tRNA nucleotidyltransferase [Oscillospiraceae bacterium]